MRATPPSRRMSAGTRSSAMTAAAPASSAIFACSALTTSMITPPLSISARPAFTRNVASSLIAPRRIARRVAHVRSWPMAIDPADLIGPDETAFTLDLTPAQLKVVARRAEDDAATTSGTRSRDVHRVLHEILAKLPDEASIRAINLDAGRLARPPARGRAARRLRRLRARRSAPSTSRVCRLADLERHAARRRGRRPSARPRSARRSPGCASTSTRRQPPAMSTAGSAAGRAPRAAAGGSVSSPA